MLGAELYLASPATQSAATSLPLRVRRQPQAKAGAGAAGRHAGAVPRARRLTDWRLSAPHLRRSLPFHRSIPSLSPLATCPFCQSRATCALLFAWLTSLPLASQAVAHYASNGVLRRQQLRFVAPLRVFCAGVVELSVCSQLAQQPR